MIDFGLKPCPMCGGEAEVARLTQGPEEMTGVIRCTDCGLTLEWETKIRVEVSRVTGKRTAEKIGLDPIEAWNLRHMCDNCADRCLAQQVLELHDCNDCGAESCEHKPRPGQHTRFNCPLWRAKEE